MGIWSMRIWEYENMEIGKYGNRENGNMEIWEY